MSKVNFCNNKCLSITSWALVVLFTILGLFFSFKAFAVPLVPRFEGKLTQNQVKYYMEMVDYNEEQAEYYMANAHNTLWYLPETKDTEKAKWCFTTAVAGIAAGTPPSRIIAMISSLLIQYGLQCIDEYNYIQYCLRCAEHHKEMAEFYSEVLILG